MSRRAIVLTMLFLTLAACAPAVAPPSASPTPLPTAEPTPAPSDPILPSPDPTAEPSPTSAPPIVVTADERYLLDGVRRGAIDCAPVRDELPPGATAGIECESDDPAVARIGFYRFPDDASMLDAYFDRMRAEGVEIETGGCDDEEGEGAYIPDEGLSLDRDGCFVNAEGYANYRATRSGSHIYIGILGRTADMGALADFAWKGNMDTPGQPTLWSEPGA